MRLSNSPCPHEQLCFGELTDAAQRPCVCWHASTLPLEIRVGSEVKFARSFQATYGDSVLLTKVKRKAEAVSEYTNAAQQGHSAALLQQQAQSRLYEIKLGNLEAKQSCVVEVAYVQHLQSLAGALEFVHTATWVPPYVQAADAHEASENHCTPDCTYSIRTLFHARQLHATWSAVCNSSRTTQTMLPASVGHASSNIKHAAPPHTHLCA